MVAARDLQRPCSEAEVLKRRSGRGSGSTTEMLLKTSSSEQGSAHSGDLVSPCRLRCNFVQDMCSEIKKIQRANKVSAPQIEDGWRLLSLAAETSV